MLDIRHIRENLEWYQKGARDKNFRVDFEEMLKLDASLRERQTKLEHHQAERNRLSKSMKSCSAEEREERRNQVLSLKSEIDTLQTDVGHIETQLNALLLAAPQPAADDVPLGVDDSGNVEVRKVGTPRDFDFTPKSHIELGEERDIIDFGRAVKIAGSRSYALKGAGARLEQAVLRFAYDTLVERGFTPLSIPVLVNESAMEGTGYFPIGREQAYYVEKDELALVGTSEVSMCGLHMNEILDAKDLPLRFMAQSSCFRREAGSYGKDTKGLYRVHQFQKVEMVIIAPNNKDQTAQLHDELLGHSEHLMQCLKLPYRVVYVCTGDLGQGQVRKHDIEAWMPSRDSYGETHSCSTFYDFQARRLKLRYKDTDGKKHQAYTLNNTACATPRILIPILENYQESDGRIRIPECLRPYMNNEEWI